MRIVTQYLSDLEFQAENETGNLIKMDSFDPKDKDSFSPTQLVLAAMAGCAAVDVVQILRKRKRTIDDLRIETLGIRREQNPHRFTHITLRFILVSPNANLTELDKAVKLVIDKYCSVSASLREDINISFDNEVVKPGN